MVRLKDDPALEDLAGTRHIPKHLLHVDVLVPELVNTGQQSHSSVPHIPCMVHKPMPHLHLRILHPDALGLVVDIEGPLPDRPCPSKVLLRLLPLRVLQKQKDILFQPHDTAGTHLGTM